MSMRAHWLIPLWILMSMPGFALAPDWVTIGDPGNPADVTGFGAVADNYRISRTEITNAEYVEFLNAVAADDTYGLYDPNMADTGIAFLGGITQSGAPGSYTYTPIPGRENRPANHISYWSALRFANWLHNLQPTGAQDASTTEDGAYTMTASGIASNSITRNPAAKIFIPNEDEWYKAAYWDESSGTYFSYPTSSDVQTLCTQPTATPNTANCSFQGFDSADVGSYPNSASPSGTFDQGGNLWEWTDAVLNGTDRILRGGSMWEGPTGLVSTNFYWALATKKRTFIGIRIAAPLESNGGTSCGLGPELLGCLLLLHGWRAKTTRKPR